MDFRTLVAEKRVDGSIRNWANYDALPATTILTEAQQMIMRGVPGSLPLRVRQMLATPQESTIAQNGESIAHPERYLKTVYFQLTGADKREIVFKDPADVESRLEWDINAARATGTPAFAYDTATGIQFDVKADRAYTYRWLFLQEFTPLSETAPTNFLTDRAAYVLRSACMAQVFTGFPRNMAERTFWLKEMTGGINQLNVENDLNMARYDIVSRPA